jgi:signal transduction histidine kinase
MPSPNSGRLSFELGELGLSESQLDTLESLDRATAEWARQPATSGPVARADRESEVESWLEGQGVRDAWEVAPMLVSMGYEPDSLAVLGQSFTTEQFPKVVTSLSRLYGTYNLLEQIGQGAGRIAGIVKALRSYTYLDQAPRQSVDIHEGLDDTLVMLGNKLGEGIVVRREYAADLPRIEAYGSELNQVWTNIIDNAVGAMEGQGDLVLRTRRGGPWVVVEIQDSGPGIPKGVLPEIFDPFFTTKPPGEGVGLGLNISHNIVVQKHKGEIAVRSEPGATCFEIRLPLNLEAVQEHDAVVESEE